eukprot:3981483-Amphidinium_carterae.1
MRPCLRHREQAGKILEGPTTASYQIDHPSTLTCNRKSILSPTSFQVEAKKKSIRMTRNVKTGKIKNHLEQKLEDAQMRSL